MRVGVTGHQHLPDTREWGWVETAIEGILAQTAAPLIGITSLAKGADQLFAELVIRRGGILEVVVPFQGYESTFTEAHDLAQYHRLLHAVAKVEILQRTGSDEMAFFVAGKKVVDEADLLIAVWNGQPAAGLGGTADIVMYAVEQHKPVIHINPISRTISQLV